jgi:hypothetical protein
MTNRPITFPKTGGTWTNRETGVFIAIYHRDGVRRYEVRMPSNNVVGWQHYAYATTLVNARSLGQSAVQSVMRPRIAQDHGDALIEDEARRRTVKPADTYADYLARWKADRATSDEARAIVASIPDAVKVAHPAVAAKCTAAEKLAKTPAEALALAREAKELADEGAARKAWPQPLCFRVDGIHVAHMVADGPECREISDEPEPAADDPIRGIRRQFCRTGLHTCTPAVTLAFEQDGLTRRLHWCADHAADADQYRNAAVEFKPAADDPIHNACGEAGPKGQVCALPAGHDESHESATVVTPATRPQPSAPADLNDDEAWQQYVAALPQPTTDDYAAVITEFGNPYAEQIKHCQMLFRAAAYSLWGYRRAGLLTDDLERTYRLRMRTARECIGMYRHMARAWARRTAEQLTNA